MVDRLAILKRLAAEVFNPALPGPLNDLDTPQRFALGTLLPPLRVAGLVERGMAGDEAAAQAITGAGLAANAQANPFLRLMPDSPGARAANAALAAFEGGDGGLVDRARAANEAGARGNEFAVGLINAVNSPSNLLGPLGAASKGTKAARLGAILTDIDRLQAMPVEALAGVARRTGGKLARKVLSDRLTPRELPPLSWPARDLAGVPEAANLPLDPDKAEVNRFLRARGLPTLPVADRPTVRGVMQPADPLVPESFNLIAAAKRGTPEAGRLNLTGEVSRLGEYNAAAREASLPELRQLPRETSPLAPNGFNIIRAAKARRAKAQPSLFDRPSTVLDEVSPTTTPAAPLRPAPEPLPEPPDISQELADESFRANETMRMALDAAYGGRAGFAFPALLKKLGASVDRFGRVLREGRDITENVLAYLDDHGKLKGRKAIDARYGALVDEVTPLRDATEAELADLIAEQSIPASVRGSDVMTGGQLAERIKAGGGKARRAIPESAFDEGEPGIDLEGELDYGDLAPLSRPGLTPPTPSALVGGRTAPTLAEMTPDEFYAALERQSNIYEPTTSVVDWGRGKQQGKRSGHMVTGSMSGAPRGETTYTHPFGNLPEVIGKKRGEIGFGLSADLDYLHDRQLIAPYLKARSAGLSHDNAMRYTYEILDPELRGLTHRTVVGEAQQQAQSPTPNVDIPSVVARGKAAKAELFEDAADVPKRLGGDIAAGGGGGGGMGIVPLAGGLSGPVGRALLPSLGGGLTGAAAGAAGGALLNEDDRLEGAKQGALAGGLAGYAGTGAASMAGLDAPLRKVATDVAENVGAIAGLARESVGVGVDANAAALTGTTSGKFLPNPKQLYGYWKRTTVEHPKNLLQDETWVRLVTRALQGKEASDQLAPLRREMQGRLRLAGNAALPQSELDDFAALGIPNHTPRYGGSLAASERQAADDLNAAQRVVSNVALSVVNPSSVVTTPLGLVASGLRGAVDAGWSGFFQSLNGVLQQTGRIAIARSERGQALAIADDLLRQRYGIADGVLPAGGRYSPEQVAKVAGKEAGEHWKVLRDTSVEAGEARARALLGDYSDEGKKGWEKALGGAVPFASWAVRSYPVIAQMALQHPLVAIGIYHYLSATKAKVEEGQPSYTAGMIPVDAATPFVGLLARYLLGGAEGVAYIDPVGSFSPVGGEVLQGDDGSEKNWYQGLNAGLGRVGLPSLGPGYQAAAFATGLDYKSPNFGSRTRGIEEAAALLPLNPQLPNAGAAALTGLRRVVSPLAEGVLPGAKGDKYAEQYDPLTRRYNELVIAETGKPLTDPSNAAFLQRLADPNDPLVQQARREVLLGGAARNATSLTSPIATVAQTDENRAYRAAAKGMPFTYATVDRQRQAGTKLADYMDQRNAAYRKANPAADTYRIGNREDAAWEQLRQWEEANKDFKFVVSATAYNRALRKKKEELGLIEPEKKTGTR